MGRLVLQTQQTVLEFGQRDYTRAETHECKQTTAILGSKDYIGAIWQQGLTGGLRFGVDKQGGGEGIPVFYTGPRTTAPKRGVFPNAGVTYAFLCGA